MSLKYVLHQNGSEHSSVTLSPHQVSHMSTKGFAFGLEILRLSDDTIDYVTIEDENNVVVVIHSANLNFEQSLTLGARREFSQDTDQQLRHLYLMESLEG